MAIAQALHRLNKQYSEPELRGELARFRALVVLAKQGNSPEIAFPKTLRTYLARAG